MYIGALSYVIYLWHWPMVVLWQLTAGDPRPWWTVGYLLLGLAAVSMAVYLTGGGESGVGTLVKLCRARSRLYRRLG